MKTSKKGRDFIRDAEGAKHLPYKDTAGLDTIGVGHLITADEKAAGLYQHAITDEEVDALLEKDLEHTENAVNALLKVHVTQNQFDALVSFAFNLGAGALKQSTLLKDVNAGHPELAVKEFVKWTKNRDPHTGELKVVPGLVARRKREADLFASSN